MLECRTETREPIVAVDSSVLDRRGKQRAERVADKEDPDAVVHADDHGRAESSGKVHRCAGTGRSATVRSDQQEQAGWRLGTDSLDDGLPYQH